MLRKLLRLNHETLSKDEIIDLQCVNILDRNPLEKALDELKKAHSHSPENKLYSGKNKDILYTHSHQRKFAQILEQLNFCFVCNWDDAGEIHEPVTQKNFDDIILHAKYGKILLKQLEELNSYKPRKATPTSFKILIHGLNELIDAKSEINNNMNLLTQCIISLSKAKLLNEENGLAIASFMQFIPIIELELSNQRPLTQEKLDKILSDQSKKIGTETNAVLSGLGLAMYEPAIPQLVQSYFHSESKKQPTQVAEKEEDNNNAQHPAVPW